MKCYVSLMRSNDGIMVQKYYEGTSRIINLSIELEIKNKQEEYYSALSISDKEGLCTKFVEYMLDMIKTSLKNLINEQSKTLSDEERLKYFKEHSGLEEFTRKDYMNIFKTISSATATRDLKKGVDIGMLRRKGENRLSKYKFRK